MANLKLSLAITNNPRTRPIVDGRVKVAGIDFAITVLGPAEMFWRQLSFAEFDVSEMSMSELMMIRARGDDRFIGMPVFTTRRFYHTGILVRKDAGIDSPAELKGKSIGVPEYIQTSALWTRGVLENEFGIAPSDMTFFMERLPERSHAGAIGFKAPPGVTINHIPPEKSIASMLLAGELDACMSYIGHAKTWSTAAIPISPTIPTSSRCFADPAAEGIRLLQEDWYLPDQSRHGRQAGGIRAGSVGGRSIFSMHSKRRTILPSPNVASMSPIISKPDWCRRTIARRSRRRSLRTGLRPTARRWKRRPNILTSRV